MVKPLRKIRHRCVVERRRACLVSHCLVVWCFGTVGDGDKNCIPRILALFLYSFWKGELVCSQVHARPERGQGKEKGREK